MAPRRRDAAASEGGSGSASAAPAAVLLPPGVDRQRAGAWLTAYGVVGLLLLGLAMAFVLGAFDGGRGPLGLEAQRRELVELLDASGRALLDAEVAARDADDGLTSTAAAAGDGSRFTTDLGLTLRNLAASLRVSILGNQPFAGPADDFERLAAQAAGIAADLDRAAASMRFGARDMGSLADDVAALRAELSRVRANLGGTIEIDRWRWFGAAIVAWLAIPAVVSLWVGLSWWRPRWIGRARRRS